MRRSVLPALACLCLLVSHLACGRGNFTPSQVTSALTGTSSSATGSSSSTSSPTAQSGSSSSTAGAPAPSTTSQSAVNVEVPAQPDDAAVSLVPNTAPAPSSFPATLTVELVGVHTQFVAGATVANFGPGISVGDGSSVGAAGENAAIHVNSPTSATAYITLDASAASGARPVIVTMGTHKSIATFFVPSHLGGPAARAAVRSFVKVGTPVHLDGSESTVQASATASDNPAGSRLSFHWTLMSAPAGSEASLADADSAQPVLVPDKPGTYIVQLTVADGASTSSTWAVLSTGNTAPVAHAGPGQFVTVGDTVQLNGSGSTDIDGDALTYQWILASAPAGSRTALSDVTAVSPTFTADVGGDYVFQLTVNDGHANTSSDTVRISTTQGQVIADAGPAASARLNDSVEFDGSASSDSAGDPITCAWQLLVRPIASAAQLNHGGSSPCSVRPNLTLDHSGLYVAQLTVSDQNGNQAFATTSANTSHLPPIANAGSARTVGIGDTVDLDASKSLDPNGGALTYFWAILSRPADSNAALYQASAIRTSFVADVEGDYVAQLIVSDGEYVSAPKTVLVSAKPPHLSASPAELSFGDQVATATTVSLPVQITNTGGGNLVLSRMAIGGADASQFSYTAAALPVTLAAGEATTINVTFTPASQDPTVASLSITDAVGSASTVPLTAFTPNRADRPTRSPGLQISPSSVVFNTQIVNTTSAASTVTISNMKSTPLNVSNVQLIGTNPGDFAFLPAATSFTIPPQGSTPLVVTFTPTASGSRSASLRITDDTGSHDIALSGRGQASGQLSLQPSSVGNNLEILAIGSVNVAPRSDLNITITSSDPTKLLLSPLSTDPTGANAGVASFVGVLPANKGVNGVGFPAFWIQSLASSGTAQITMTATGYNPATATITMTPSGFVLTSPLGLGTDFTTLLNASDTSLTVSAAQFDSGGNVLLTDQRLRGGTSTSVDVVSATPAIGTIGGTPVAFTAGGITSGTVTFHPVAIGTTQLSITQPSGFTAPVSGSKLSATVKSPAISLIPSVVGYNLEVAGAGSLNIAAPTGGLSVTINSSDITKVLLSTDPLAAGSGSVTLTVPAGTTALPAFYIQGLASSGSVTLTANATGYAGATAGVQLYPSGFVLNSPNNGGSFTTTTLSGATSLTASVWQLNGTAPVTAGQIRGGISVPVTVTSGNPDAGSIFGGSLTFAGGDSAKTSISFQPNPNCTTPCTSVLSVSASGYTTPVPGGQITATVNKPTVSVLVIQKTIGQNLQVTGSGSLDVPAPADLQVTISSDNPNVVLSTDPTLLGTNSITVTVPAGSGVNSIGFPSYYIQSIGSSGTANLTISASGFSSTSTAVTLAASAFVIAGPNGVGTDFGTVLANGNVTLTIRPSVLNAGAPTLLYEAVRGGLSASIAVNTSDPTIATIGGTPLLVTSGNDTGTVLLQPVAVGHATITMTTPSGFSTPSSGNHLTVTIN